jgi:aminoglycoside phosphotransferase family enzyme/predicted kinase
MLQALRRPAAYPWHPPSVELITTHISWVFLAGDRVVKLKRPVAYDFVDQTSLATRHRLCLAELALNRRLTSDVYLSVEPVVATSEGYRLGGDGPSVEWATVMRRLSGDQMLNSLLEAGKAPPDLATLLAERLIPFHRDIATNCAESPEGPVEATISVVTDNTDQLAPFVGSILPRQQFSLVATALRIFAQTERLWFEQRVADGWVREGHGDLRAEHICLEPNGVVQIFDCVEFSKAIRCADIASDLAFLLIDLDRLGAGDVAADVLARYGASGLSMPAQLIRFYSAHRALVRVKVICLSLDRIDSSRRLDLLQQAALYLDLATRAAVLFKPLMVVMTGLSGTGKSTVADAIGRATGAKVLSSDRVRKSLAGVEGPTPSAWKEGLYGPEWTERTYRRLMELASDTLGQGTFVVLDASFLEPAHRQLAAEAATRAGVTPLFVQTTCNEDIVAKRIAARQASGQSLSDATLDIHRRQRATVSAHQAAMPEGVIHINIDTSSQGPIDLDPFFSELDAAGMLAPRIPSTALFPTTS